MRSRALILAYDGVLVQSLDARAAALLEGLHAEGIPAELDDVRRAVAGRSLAEAVLDVCHHLSEAVKEVPDAVSLNLAALRAERAYAAAAARGLPLVTGALPFAQERSARERLVVRADSRRTEVSRTLAMTQLEQHVTLSCCSDDRGLRQAAGTSEAEDMIEAAYRHITERLAALGIAASECIVCEPSAHARKAALRHGFRVFHSDAVREPDPAVE